MGYLRRKYKKDRRPMREALGGIICPVLAMCIIKTYTASKHKNHITKFWYLLRNHSEARDDYNTNLMGKHLTGRDEFWHTMYFANKPFWYKWHGMIPERIAMGDAYAVAISFMKKHSNKR